MTNKTWNILTENTPDAAFRRLPPQTYKENTQYLRAEVTAVDRLFWHTDVEAVIFLQFCFAAFAQ